MAAGVQGVKRSNPFEEFFKKKGKSDHIVQSNIHYDRVFAKDIKHRLLLELAHNMGYKKYAEETIFGGFCAGITSMGNFAILIDQVPQFNQRLFKIKSVYDAVVQGHRDSKSVSKDELFEKTALELSKDYDVRAFFDGIVFCQSSVNGTLTLGIEEDESSMKSIQNMLFSYVESIELERQGGAEFAFSTALVADFEELSLYLLKLKTCFDANKASACINFSTLTHVVSIGYDYKKQVFYFNDSNHLVIKEIRLMHELLETIYREITDQKTNPESFNVLKKIVVGLEIITLKGALKLQPPGFLDDLSDEQIKDKAAYKNQSNDSLAALAAQAGDADTLKKLISINADIKGLIPLERACMWGCLDLVKMIIEGPRAKMEKGFYGMTKALRVAVAKGHFGVVKYLIEQGINIQSKDKDQIPVISLAAKYGRVSLVKLLLDKNTNPNCTESNEGRSPLHFAILGCLTNNSTDNVRMLIEAKANVNSVTKYGKSSLHYAAMYGNAVVLNMLLKAGANINLQDNKGNSALLLAVEQGKEESVKVLLEHGANPTLENYSGVTPLKQAIKNRYYKIISMLAKAGVDVNKSDVYEKTTLFSALLSHDLNSAKVLLECGADINQLDHDGKNLMQLAIKNNDIAMVDLLLQLGFSIEKEDSNGLTPLLYAITIDNFEAVKYLVEKKANPFPKDKQGNTSIFYAIKNKSSRIRKLLLSLDGHQKFLAKTLEQIADSL